jgi:hypothetical protein
MLTLHGKSMYIFHGSSQRTVTCERGHVNVKGDQRRRLRAGAPAGRRREPGEGCDSSLGRSRHKGPAPVEAARRTAALDPVVAGRRGRRIARWLA